MSFFTFEHAHQEDFKTLTQKLGGKGASLWMMTHELNLPVPPGFTIPTNYGAKFKDGNVSGDVIENAKIFLEKIGSQIGRSYGDPERPLIVSVRSGAAISMPGMMDTILNVGLTPMTLNALEKVTGKRHFALESYGRFLSQFAEIVLGLDAKIGNPDNLENKVSELTNRIHAHLGEDILNDPWKILEYCIQAVFTSWNSPRAKHYRKEMNLPDDSGTAVNIQSMVFGNIDDNSGTGVVFTRNPSTGEAEPTGDYIINAQGEDVVAGLAKTRPYSELETINPKAFKQLQKAIPVLEKYYQDMVDIEFTIESGKLWILQTRKGKRTPSAAAKIAIDLVEDTSFNLDRKGALERLPQDYLNKISTKINDTTQTSLTTGLGASPGLASGIVVFSADEAIEKSDETNVILVRQETSPADIHGMSIAAGILTTLGGQMSHAAVVARDWSLPAVVGADQIELATDHFTVNGHVIRGGDTISIDGKTGQVFLGEIEAKEEADPSLLILRDWAKDLKENPAI